MTTHSWAPESFWDAGRGQYAVLYSAVNASGHNVIMVNYTSDFVTASAPQVFFDPGYDAIDANMTVGVGGVNWLDPVEEGEGFGGVRPHEAFQTVRRDLRPPAGPGPHLFLEGADGLVQIARVGGDGLGEFGAIQHREVRARPQRGHQVGGVAQQHHPGHVGPGGGPRAGRRSYATRCNLALRQSQSILLLRSGT